MTRLGCRHASVECKYKALIAVNWVYDATIGKYSLIAVNRVYDATIDKYALIAVKWVCDMTVGGYLYQHDR